LRKWGNSLKHIEVSEIAYIKAEDNEVVLVTKTTQPGIIIDYTLDQLGGLMDPNQFFRINRSYMATIGSIGKISKYFNSRLHIETFCLKQKIQY